MRTIIYEATVVVPQITYKTIQIELSEDDLSTVLEEVQTEMRANITSASDLLDFISDDKQLATVLQLRGLTEKMGKLNERIAKKLWMKASAPWQCAHDECVSCDDERYGGFIRAYIKPQ
jgi:hypothetical protein